MGKGKSIVNLRASSFLVIEATLTFCRVIKMGALRHVSGDLCPNPEGFVPWALDLITTWHLKRGSTIDQNLDVENMPLPG